MTAPLHKNNVGLDLKQLFIGTSGQYGIVTEVVAKTSPAITESATALLVPTSNETIPALQKRLEDIFGGYLTAVEGMSKNALDAAHKYNGQNITKPYGDSNPEYCLLVEISRSGPKLEGDMELEDRLITGLSAIYDSDDSLFDIESVLPTTSNDFWNIRHALSEGVQKSGKLVGFDISFTRDKTMEFRSFMQKALPENFPGVRICDFGHIGDGAMHLSLVIDPEDERLKDPAFIPALQEWVFDRVVHDFNGSYSAEHGRGRLNDAAYEKYTPQEIKALHQQIYGALVPPTS